MGERRVEASPEVSGGRSHRHESGSLGGSFDSLRPFGPPLAQDDEVETAPPKRPRRGAELVHRGLDLGQSRVTPGAGLRLPAVLRGLAQADGSLAGAHHRLQEAAFDDQERAVRLPAGGECNLLRKLQWKPGALRVGRRWEAG